MPDFSLAAIPGLQGAFTLAENASGIPVQIGLKDAVLFLPGQQRLPLTASHQRGNGGAHLLTLTGAFAPARDLLAGQLSLESLTLALRFRDANGVMVLDAAGSSAPVTASGLVKWSGAAAVGLANGVDLQLSYRIGSGAGSGAGGGNGAAGFALALANVPLAVPGGFAEIQSGEIGAEFPVDRPVLAVTLRGAARLTANGQADADNLLRQLFPAAPAIQPLGFVVRQEFTLVNGAVPALGQPAALPFFRFDFDWPQGALPALSNLPAPLRIDLGRPAFSLPLAAPGSSGSGGGSGGGSGQLPTWTLRLPDTGIRFPTLAALSPFQLLGTLHVESGGVNRVAFQPSASGGFELPDPLQFLVSRLGWGGRREPLDQVAQSATLSIGDFEWQSLFQGLLPSPIPVGGLDLNALGRDLDQAIAGAIAQGGITFDRIFFTAMQGLRGGGLPAYGVLWNKWFTPSAAGTNPSGANPFDALPPLLLSITGMAADARDAAIAALFDTIPSSIADFGAFTASLLKSWAAAAGAQFDQFVQLMTHLLRAGLPRLSAARLDLFGAGLMDALVRLPELQPLRALPGLPSMPLGDAMLASSLAGLTSEGANSSSSSGLLAAMFSNTNQRTPAEARRAKDAIINAASKAGKAIDFVLGAVHNAAVGAGRHFMPWWDLMDRPVNRETRGDSVLQLPRGKYLIVSDVHRDRLSDEGRLLDFNSISHFQKNRELFKQVIDYAKTQQYTLIEGGDCEELWFVRDRADSDRATMLREIIRDNQDVYDALRDLHRANRYVRIYGNHDSQLRDPDIGAILKTEMERGGGPAFTIRDFIVIDGVKTMTEGTVLDKAIALATGIASGTPPEQIARDLAKGSIGMDANDYTETCQMLVTHGHQWDFWNCDQNNTLGMFIANEVGVRVDKAMDPILAARGVAIAGNPWIDFGAVLAGTPITNCWPAESEAVRLAHQVQHMANADRRLLDSFQYKESLAAVTGTFGIALNASGTNATPEQSRRNVDISRPGTILEYLKKHHNHHICVGHTHNPHSQPHLTLSNIGTGMPLIGNVLLLMKAVLPVNPNLLKSKYFNSGASGWWQGVIWAIQIDDDGQARLVYWTNHTLFEPETMDWELTAWDDDIRRQFPKTREQLLEALRKFLDNVIKPEELGALMQTMLAAPIELLQAAIARGEALFSQARSELDEVSAGVRARVKESVEELKERAERLQQHMLEVLLTLRSRASGFRTAAEDVFRMAIEVSDAVRDELLDLSQRVPASGPHAAAQKLHAAVVAWPLVENYPHNLALGAVANPRFHPERLVFDSKAPALSIFSAVVALFRPAGCLTRVGNQIIESKIEFVDNDTRLQLTVTLRTDTSSAAVPNA